MTRSMLDVPTPAPTVIRAGPAVGTWAVAWVVATIVVVPIVVVALGAELGDDLTIPELTAAALAGWAVFVAALVAVSRRFGTGDPVADLAARFRPIDLIGVPIGIVTQLGVIPLLYLPLQQWWPDTFSDERLEERAQDLADRAGGAASVLLVLVVAVGAPIVEELVYRGLLQRSLATVIGPLGGLVVTSIWFGLVHPSPVEYPGLIAAGLVFGAGVVATNRIGLSVVTHAAFNATGITVLLAAG